MKRRILGLFMTLAMLLSLVPTTAFASIDTRDIKIGFVYVGDENEGYTLAHMDGIHAAMEKLGIPDDAIIEYTNVPEDEMCYDKCVDLAERGCDVIFTNSYGHQSYCAQAAREYPDVQFVAMTGDFAAISGLGNLSNATCSTHESRYVSGVVAGMKLKQLMDDGVITDPYVGYVAAFPYAEVISDYTAFFLGIRSIVPDAHMDVRYTQSWFDWTGEAEAANSLMAHGCVIIGQHSDSTGVSCAVEAALEEGRVAYSVGYNIDMLSVAPNAALTSAQNNWEVYFEYALSQVMAGKKIAADWCKGFAEGAVMISALGESCDPGTAEKVAEVEAAIKDGSLKIFDTANFTVDGEAVTSAPVDMSIGYWGADGFTELYHGDTVDAIVDGAFAESTFRSAPYFTLKIDGITELDDSEPLDITVSGTATIGENQIPLPDGGQVFYAFTPQESGQYLFTSWDMEDTYALLLDANYNIIAEDDDSGDALNFLITYNLEAGETYYIGVKYLNEQAGTIALHIEQHEHEWGHWRSIWNEDLGPDISTGHAQVCPICNYVLSDEEPHQYDGNYCTVCGAVNPDHECVAYDWYDYWGEDGHFKECRICGKQLSDLEPHTYKNNRCTVCGAPDPNHECVPGNWHIYTEWDENLGTQVVGHVRSCTICDRPMSDIEPHTYKGDYCTVCGAVNPDHECVPADWLVENYDAVNGGHYHVCAICYKQLSDVEPHTFDGNHCTACDASDPNHECISDGTWSRWSYGFHAQRCSICGERLSELEEHTFEHGRCTVCGDYDDDHVHNDSYCANSGSHQKICSICWDEEPREEHQYNADGVCTVCGWIRDARTAVKLNIRIGQNKELILTATYADGTTREMTVTGFEVELNAMLANNWREKGGTTYTDKGTLSCSFCKNDDGRFYVALLDDNCNQIIASNVIDGCEWYDAYFAVQKANITDPDCSYKNGIWTATGVAYDGRNVCVTMDDTYNIIGYAAAGMLGDVNNDGKVNQKDVARLRQYIADSNNYPLDAQQNADVNNDGKINQKDVARLRQYIADGTNYPLG